MEALKEEGNAHFNKGDYEASYKCYTKAIAAAPLNAVLYSNRSAAALALHRYREAELDAGIAVSLDAKFAKGFYRRAQARVAQGRVQEARFDVEQLKRLGQVKQADALLREIEQAEEREKKAKERTKVVLTKEEERVEVVVVKREEKTEAAKETIVKEVKEANVKNEPQSVGASSVVAPAAAVVVGAAVPAVSLPKLSLKAPANAFEFEAGIVNVRKDPESLADYVALLSPNTVTKVIGNALTEEMFATLCSAMLHEKFDVALAVNLVSAISKCPRFDVVSAFFDDSTKQVLRKLFEKWGDETPNALKKMAE